MKKRLLSLSLAVVLALGLFSACGSTSASSVAAPAASGGAAGSSTASAGVEADLEIWIYEEFFKDGDTSPIAVATQQFMDENPGVNISFTPVPYGSSEYRDKYIQAANGGGGPDLLMSDNIWVPQFAAMDIIVPLTERVGDKKDEFFTGPIDAAMYNGELYGVPFAADSMVLFYNKDMFKAAGLDPEAPPKTWEEFRDYAIALRDNGMGGYGLLGGWGGSFEWLPWLWQNGGDIVNENGEVTFNSPEGMEATKFFLNLLTVDEVVPETALTWKSWDELATGFANQTVGMCQGMAVMYNGLTRLNPEFDWGVAPLPGRKEQANTLGGNHWVINKNTAQTEAAYAWIDFISSKEQNLALCDDYLRVSARSDALEQEQAKNDEITAVFIEALEYARPRPIIPEWTTIDYDCIQPAFMKVIFEGEDIEKSMQEAEKQAIAILSE